MHFIYYIIYCYIVLYLYNCLNNGTLILKKLLHEKILIVSSWNHRWGLMRLVNLSLIKLSPEAN